MPNSQALPTDKEMLVMLRQRLTNLEATVLDLMAIYEHTGQERQRSMQRMLDTMRQTFQEAVIADPDMTDAQRAYWLRLPTADEPQPPAGPGTRRRPIWEQWGGMVGITDRLLARSRGNYWAKNPTAYPTPDEDIVRLLELLENRRQARRDQVTRLTNLLHNLAACDECHGGLHDNDACPHWGPIQEFIDEMTKSLHPSTTEGQ